MRQKKKNRVEIQYMLKSRNMKKEGEKVGGKVGGMDYKKQGQYDFKKDVCTVRFSG